MAGPCRDQGRNPYSHHALGENLATPGSQHVTGASNTPIMPWVRTSCRWSL